MKLYSYWRSSCAWRVRSVLNLKGIEFEYAAVNIAPSVNQHHSAEYASVNALQQVPTLEWQEAGQTHRLTQSVAIVEYLEELQPEPRLMPSAPLARARVREALEIVNSGIQPLQNTWLQHQLRQLGGESVVSPFVQSVIQRGLAVLEQHAERHGGRYCVGDTLSLADVYLVPQLYNARRAGIDVSTFPRLAAIDQTLSVLPAFAGARPERQPDAAQA